MNLEDWISSASYEAIDGRRIAYWTAGSGRPLLLVHGYPTASWDWHRVWAELAKSRRLIRPNQRLVEPGVTGFALANQFPLQVRLQRCSFL